MIDIKNTIKFEENCWVGEVDASQFNSSEENRIKAVTDMASITTGMLGFRENPLSSEYVLKDKVFDKDVAVENQKIITSNWNRRKALYNRLLTESANKPSLPFEFIPVQSAEQLSEGVPYLRYGDYNEVDEIFATNLRNNFKAIPPKYNKNFNTSEQLTGFKIIVGQIPIKVLSHLRTHRAFSFLVESSRNKKYLNNVAFWYPSWWYEDIIKSIKRDDLINVANLKTEVSAKHLKPEEATMELSDRRLVYFAMAAWKQDVNAWDNLFAVRGPGTGTQSITGMTVDNIKTLVDGKK